ncbi:hypothetical protein ACWEVM_18970 [Streptomyces bauhiniae]|uniref:hypothetical protein n=1 Tax=Streptomyces bauhiniae TaxID=2340725 RepID=UPI003675C0CF
MKELEEIRKQLARLDDPTIGLSALHGEVTQSRLKIQEVVQNGVTGLREENRELRRRQDRMTVELNDSRGEIRQLLERAEAAPDADPPEQEADETGTPQPFPIDQAPDASRAAQQPAPSDSEPQGDLVENAERQPVPGDADRDTALKDSVMAAYRGAENDTQPSDVAPAGSGAPPESPLVAHGVLLLKAAGVASAEVFIHRDTWDWLIALTVGHDHFQIPPAVEDKGEGRVQLVLSGRSLIALLIELWDIRASAPLGADWALAATIYSRIAADLVQVTGKGQPIRVVLDDGLAES